MFVEGLTLSIGQLCLFSSCLEIDKIAPMIANRHGRQLEHRRRDNGDSVCARRNNNNNNIDSGDNNELAKMSATTVIFNQRDLLALLFVCRSLSASLLIGLFVWMFVGGLVTSVQMTTAAERCIYLRALLLAHLLARPLSRRRSA